MEKQIENIETSRKKVAMSSEKKRMYLICLLGSLCLGCVSGLVGLFGFESTAIRMSASYNYETSALSKTTYDYMVFDPIQSQISEMKGQDFISDIFEYYSHNSTITFGEKSFDTKAVFSENTDALSITAYNNKRVISGAISYGEGEIMVDQKVASSLGASVGSSLTVTVGKTQNMIFSVKAILEDNTFYDNQSVFFNFSGDAKTAIANAYPSLSYSGVYVKASNKASAKTYLNDYKPMGRMLTRDYFSTDSEYENYKSNFLSTDYSSEIYDRAASLASSENTFGPTLSEAKKLAMYGGVVSGVIMLLSVLVSVGAMTFVRKSNKLTNSAVGTDTGSLRKRILLSSFFGYGTSGLIIGIGTGASIASSVGGGAIAGTAGASISISLLASLIIVLVSSYFILGKANSKKMQ